ncbi:hypothetical protein RQM59_14060 [Flavobacteriaceae bacterium S356]|uniref:Uncharacterized protein n=1 Tax=Asprobacillus argus TaxID=3076534 RepID=A0ABU3LJP1_9FLAO|nr:hypothetical protein [Flavobacteriaceae bacterium S356]
MKRWFAFTLLYVASSFLLIPNISPYFGRVQIKESKSIHAHSFFTKLLNRNYVTEEMNQVITNVAVQLQKEYSGIKVMYLDANFPFFDSFPLLPHLSHNDGKKIDLAFTYEETNGALTNLKKSRSGYGVFEHPNNKGLDQTTKCKKQGFWQYDYSKFVTFGEINNHLTFSNRANTRLINLIASHPKVEKIFVEPHLKHRLKLKSSKIRFQGCRSVRHDDHIHVQIH